ncbi:MAG TPA: MFS transporter [bacterium]|nr:MFS transporter [bacterium]
MESAVETEARSGGDRHAKDLALLSSAHAVTHIQPTLYPLIFPEAMQALGFGYAQIGLLVGAIGVIGGLLQGVQGWLSRRFRRKALCGGGNLLLGLSIGLSGLAGSFAALLGLRLLATIATSPQHPIGSSLLADWYPRKRRASAFALHFSGGNLGTVLTPLVVGVLLPRVGWRHTLMLFGIPGVIVGLLFWLLADDRRPAAIRSRSEGAGARTPYLAAARNPNVLALLLSRALTSGGRGLGIILTYVPLYLLSGLRLAPSTAGAFVAVLAAGSVISPLLAGRVADGLGRRRPVMIASLWISAIATTGLARTGASLPGILAALIVLSLAVYNESSLSQALLAEIVTDEERDGAFSLFYVVSFTGAAVWGVAIGLAIARFGFPAGFALMVSSYLLASVVLFFVREAAARP